MSPAWSVGSAGAGGVAAGAQGRRSRRSGPVNGWMHGRGGFLGEGSQKGLRFRMVFRCR